MNPYIVLADQYARSTLPDLAHSALPGAPQQPYAERRRFRQGLLASWRRRRAAHASEHPLRGLCDDGRPVACPR